MSVVEVPRYDRWKAPADEGQTLIWPAPADLLRDTLANSNRLRSAGSCRIQNVPLSEVRQCFREWLGHTDDDRPIIATGHQTELHHPGVWVKNAMIDAVATQLQGRAVHFAVDTDEPKHLALKWPGGAMPLSDESARVPWSGLLNCPPPAHIERLAQSFNEASRSWSFQPLVPDFLASLRKLALETVTLPNALTNALHELDWRLGLRYDALLMSPVCLCEPYLVFVHHVLARADAFAADYNASLEEFRKANKIRTPGRPMPNLQASEQGVEVPFWLDDLAAGTRTRAAVMREQGGFALELPNGERFSFRANVDGWTAAGELMMWLRRNGVRLAPRALTLTAVLRLLVADQFVHGIGGGQYDQVLDRLIARHFRIDPPGFAVTTATLYFPGAANRSRPCVSCLVHEGHQLRHRLLGDEKREYVAAITAAPRNSPQREQLFFQMHDRLASAANDNPTLQEWSTRLSDARRREQDERVLWDRELFYALQPADRLGQMIETYRGAFRK